jgi:DNA mismatch endonuclease (patch repair protein)
VPREDPADDRDAKQVRDGTEAGASWATSLGVRSRMQSQRSRDTTPEMALRRLLHARGLRYRVHRQVVPGTRRAVDVVFGTAKVAVDVRGCYWHGHDHDQSEYRRTKNLEYWVPKIAGNRARDLDTEARLRQAGWEVIVVWECDDLPEAALRIEAAVRSRRDRTAQSPA